MRKDSGFTLMEIMVTISVAAILIGTGVPSMIEFMKNNRRAAATNALVADVQRARGTAANAGADVLLCHATTSTCSGAANPDWAEGWLMFADANGNGTADAGEDVFSVQGRRDGVRMPSNATRFDFTAGFSAEMTGGTVAVCIEGDANDRWVIVSRTGRPRIAETNSDVSC